VSRSATPPEPTQVTSTRGLVVGLVLGLPIIGYGIRGAMIDAADTRPAELAAWILGSGVVDDLVLIPAACAVGFLARRLVPAAAWPTVRAGLIVTGALCLVAWPFVRGYGRDPSIPSLLNRNYSAGLAVAVVVAWVAVAVRVTVTIVLASRRGRPG
jgi:hypothetical protein